eukprot:CAMPEP_0179466012 /NCGR_PEP_ID=MMETSP0799-20121207/47446_1 /TAXON_ID=46947 /ORGANISM="Geminigera cryophila, Strain CCMP2564" /LENGTH=205 /DNA_ID=CAMNT_0021270605 /DNA_START=172 /DNA_END=785 /DNA_ORIENTATION=-
MAAQAAKETGSGAANLQLGPAPGPPRPERPASVTYAGQELPIVRCVDGATIWSDRDGRNGESHHKLRSVPLKLKGCFLAQLPVRVKGPVTLQLREAATVFVCFAGGGRDGGLTPMLLANGWRRETTLEGFDWNSPGIDWKKVEKFAVVLSKVAPADFSGDLLPFPQLSKPHQTGRMHLKDLTCCILIRFRSPKWHPPGCGNPNTG